MTVQQNLMSYIQVIRGKVINYVNAVKALKCEIKKTIPRNEVIDVI